MPGRPLLTMLAVALATAVLLPAARADGPDRTPVEQAPGYRIGPEDVLQISVWKNDALSRVVPVRPDGMISLPLLDDVPAAGLTPLELRDRLAQRLTEYIPSPEVSVIVTEVRSFKVSVLGQVAKPGRFELKSRATVLDDVVISEKGAQMNASLRPGDIVLVP